MFSYRHAYHAGNHADVLKHTVLIATLRHLQLKDPALTLVDTHAGAGLYRLDGDYADKGGEAEHGVVRLFAACRPAAGQPSAAATPLLDDYLDLVSSFNPSGSLRIYPGSPFVIQHLMRAESRDRLKLFELHPADAKTLTANLGQLDAGRTVSVKREDGFEGLKPLLPPPADAKGSRRGLVLIDPSY
jgi:23S rRNA (adenine2030-N6)-methyltransferase